MKYATIRNTNLKESKESERNLALLLQVPFQFPLSGNTVIHSSHTFLTINMNDFFQLQLFGAVIHYRETQSIKHQQ